MAETLVDTRHADENNGDVRAVVVVSDELEPGGGKAFGFIDDEQFNPPCHVGGAAGDLAYGASMVIDAEPDTDLPAVYLLYEFAGLVEYVGVEKTVRDRLACALWRASSSERGGRSSR